MSGPASVGQTSSYEVWLRVWQTSIASTGKTTAIRTEILRALAEGRKLRITDPKAGGSE